MFSAKISNFHHSLAFRLTLRHTLVFTAASVAAFLALYVVVYTYTQNKTDTAMLDQAREFENVFLTQGMAALENEIRTESAAYGTQDVFIRLVSPQGETILQSDAKEWKGVPTISPARQQTNAPQSDTINISGHHNPVRTLTYPFSGDMTLQIAESLKENEHLLKWFRIIFGSSLLTVTCLAALFGWIIAKRALSKVESVTQTATKISEGALDSRVPIQGGGDEIDHLAAAFNTMLDRIQQLVNEVRQTNDNIAHELRSPVARIRGLAEHALASDASPKEMKHVAENTVEECDRLLGMINVMLDIAAAEAGVVKMKHLPTDVTLLAQNACELFRPVAEDKGIAINIEKSEPALVQGDVQKLQRAVANLIDNAIKYTPAGGNVSVNTRLQHDFVLVSVGDTGIGISEADLPHLFERFYRSDRSRTKIGSGLGLSLASALVRAHGGDIQVTSRVGFGSLFTVRLPLHRPENAPSLDAGKMTN